MTREEYRKEIVLESDIKEQGQNCRLALNRFFMSFVPKKTKEMTISDLLIAAAPLIGSGVNIEYTDSRWKAYDVDYYKEIKKNSWFMQDNPTGGLSYEVDYNDCDDFAELSKSLMSMFGKTNSMARCKGYVVYNGVATAHAFNVVFAIDENDKVKPYLWDTEFNTDLIPLTSNRATVRDTYWIITNIRI